MNGAGLPDGVDLGRQEVPIHKLTTYPAHGVDVLAGSPIPGPFTHHVRVVLPTEGQAILLPCDRRALNTLRRQLDELLHREGVHDGK